MSSDDQKTYRVETPILHGGARYETGQHISLTDVQAAPMLARTPPLISVDAAPEVAESSDEKARPEDAELAHQAIVDAIAGLDAENTDHYNLDGTPKVDAISAALGWPVSAAERTAAWVSMAQSQA